jgi:hypothetical protein
MAPKPPAEAFERVSQSLFADISNEELQRAIAIGGDLDAAAPDDRCWFVRLTFRQLTALPEAEQLIFARWSFGQ